MGNPDGIFTFPGQPPIPCGVLEMVGIELENAIPPTACEMLPELISFVCYCQSPAFEEVTGPPLLPPTFSPVSIAPVTESSSPLHQPIPPGACAVCGADKCVTRPNEIIVTPGQPSISCGQLEQDGIDFLIPSSICATVFEDISQKCGCQARIEQGAQSGASETVATEAPVQLAPTKAPAAPDAPPVAMEEPKSSRVPERSKKEKA